MHIVCSDFSTFVNSDFNVSNLIYCTSEIMRFYESLDFYFQDNEFLILCSKLHRPGKCSLEML